MKRRTFLNSLLGGIGLGVLVRPARARMASSTILVQESPVAGFQHHKGEHLWSFLRPGEPLRLVRETGNAHDPNAVAVYFRGDKLGYVPRRENATVAQMLDRGQRLEARIVRLLDEPNPWRRVRFSVELLA